MSESPPPEVPGFLPPYPDEDDAPLVQPGTTTMIIGSQFGSEGLEKVVEFLAGKHKVDIVASYQNGGPRKIKLGEKDVLVNLLPSGIGKPDIVNVLGPGYSIDPDILLKDLEMVGVTNEDAKERLLISPNAHLYLQLKNNHSSPSETKRIKTEFSIVEFVEDSDYVICQVNNMRNYIRSQHRYLETSEPRLRMIRDGLTKLDIIQKDPGFMAKALSSGKSVLIEIEGVSTEGSFETEPASLLDIKRALCIPPASIKRKIGVLKAYMSCSSHEFFPTAFNQTNPDNDKLLYFEQVNGIDPGQRASLGYLDLTLVRQSKSQNIFDSLILTYLYALSSFEEIHVAVGYDLDGKLIDKCSASRMRSEIIYKTFPGWNGEAIALDSYQDLPDACKRLICYVESHCECPIVLIEVENGRFLERPDGQIHDFRGFRRQNEIKRGYSEQFNRKYDQRTTTPEYLEAQRLVEEELRVWAIQQRRIAREEEKKREEQPPTPLLVRVRAFFNEIFGRINCFS